MDCCGLSSSVEQLSEIERSPVLAYRGSGPWSQDITVSLPHNPHFLGEFDETGERLFLHELEVNQDLRGRGIATRLMKAMIYAGKAEGANIMHSDVDSPHSVRIFKKIFPETAVKYYDIDPETNERVELPMLFDEAIASLERHQEHRKEVEDADRGGFDFEADLTKVPFSNLEQPVNKRK
jgi:GNAT superfamily N-acetyltransferase